MKGLKNETDLAIADARAAILVERRELRSVQPYFSGGRLVEAREQREQRGLAGARRSHDRSCVPARHADRDGIEDGQLALGAANLFCEMLCS